MNLVRLRELVNNAVFTYHEEGIRAFTERLRVHANSIRAQRRQEGLAFQDFYTDVLFINGCAYSVPHPVRYRVDHQLEQCLAYGLSARKVDEWNLHPDDVRTARVFIIFRCPYNERVGAFIDEAHRLNKTVLYDIDDLVIDRKYTNQIPFLDTLTPEDRAGYDSGVDAMQKTMLMCDGVITTTEGMADELGHYLSEVFINRNVASEEMVFRSERAIQERDVYPFISKDEVPKRDLHRWKNAVKRYQERDEKLIHIGYFSGSITHNDDFDAILPAIQDILESHPYVRLHIVGELDVPSGLEAYRSQIIAEPFTSWRRLPKLISSMDINIAPLVDSIFNRAKSENKWLEAALVKVPTVASKVGAFAHCIEDGRTGVLCDSISEWKEALSHLISDRGLRKQIGEAAYQECVAHKTTISAGCGLVDFIKRVQTSNIAFAIPSTSISGGNLVTRKHALIMHDRGYDVTFIDGFGDDRWWGSDEVKLPVVNRRVLPANIDNCPIQGYFDKLVATFWETEQFVSRYWRAASKYYFVQNLESGFYNPRDWHRIEASATYRDEVTCITISTWCKDWLETDFGRNARYARNGLNLEQFFPVERDYSGKVRILVEGDCSVDYKNVDESFRITNKLDPRHFEVWYLSYNGQPKSFYRVDKFLHSVPYEKVADVYRQCHILLKTSVLESFSYPPLEMMATGGAAVVLSNPGNMEYLIDEENALLFKHGEEDRAAALIERIASDEGLRERLRENGIKTAQSRDWSLLENEIASLYE